MNLLIIKNYINTLVECYHKIDAIPGPSCNMEDFLNTNIDPLLEEIRYHIAGILNIDGNKNFDAIIEGINKSYPADYFIRLGLTQEDK